MKTLSDQEWLLRQAALEDNCYVSSGGLVTAVEELQAKRMGANVMRSAFAQLVRLFRRERQMTQDQFAEDLDVELGEIVSLEGGDLIRPSPRTIHKLSEKMKVPSSKLFVLSGLAEARDTGIQDESLKFAARSQPLETLSAGEHQVLSEWVKYLCEK
jgi:HTH-type transcriptional regulator, competence development regulator